MRRRPVFIVVGAIEILWWWPRAGSGVVRIDPLRFLAGCRTRRLNQLRYMVLLFIRAPFYVSLFFVAMCSVFWLFWLSYQYFPSDWLEWLLWGSLIVARRSSPESPGRRVRIIFYFSWFIVLLHCFIMYLCCLLPLCDIFSYCYDGTIWPICAESAVKPQTNKQTIKQSMLMMMVVVMIQRTDIALNTVSPVKLS